MEIRKLDETEAAEALRLVWEVFQEFEAPDYSQEGVDTFKRCIDDPEFVGRLIFYGAFTGEGLRGVLATRNNGCHLAMFFVRKEEHQRGFGRRLFEYAVESCPEIKMTVNSSPYAVPIYEKLGFVRTDAEQVKDGIRYTPMTYEKK